MGPFEFIKTINQTNKDLIKVIVKLKKKIEYRIGRKIKNYKIHNIAVSNKSKVPYFIQ